MSVTTEHQPRYRPLVVAFLIATCIRVWIGPISVTPRAYAQIPNAGKQRLELVQQTRKTNELLARIAKTLESGTLKVEIASTDKPVGQRPSPHGP